MGEARPEESKGRLEACMYLLRFHRRRSLATIVGLRG